MQKTFLLTSHPLLLHFSAGPVHFHYYSQSTNQRFHTHPAHLPALLPIVTLQDPPSGPPQDHLLPSWPPSPGLISLNLHVRSPHCSTYLPLAILSPSCQVTSLSSPFCRSRCAPHLQTFLRPQPSPAVGPLFSF